MYRTVYRLRGVALGSLVVLLAGCDLGQSPSPEFRLTTFPIPGRTYSNITIIAVFDHSMSAPDCPDKRVVAYTGETGQEEKAAGLFNFGCGDLSAFGQPGGAPFTINGNYRNHRDVGLADLLLYDGHPAYDFLTTDLCPGTSTTPSELCPLPGQRGRVRLRAAADGVVACTDFDGGEGCPEGPGVVKIRHREDFHTVYMHLESAEVRTGDRIAAGQSIGVAGARGSNGQNDFFPHLHFEVRQGTIPVDPYGWEPTDRADPYTSAASYWMWADAEE